MRWPGNGSRDFEKRQFARLARRFRTENGDRDRDRDGVATVRADCYASQCQSFAFVRKLSLSDERGKKLPHWAPNAS